MSLSHLIDTVCTEGGTEGLDSWERTIISFSKFPNRVTVTWSKGMVIRLGKVKKSGQLRTAWDSTQRIKRLVYRGFIERCRTRN
jgi:hypothetical protein